VPIYYCRSEYFYSQCPRVQNLIRIEHSLNRGECRVKSEAKQRVFPIYGNQIMEVGVMLEVTRGRVDNENNNQSQYSNISNNIQSGSLIYKLESITIRNRKYWNMDQNTAR